MTWTKDYERLMREQGREPYACPVEGCRKVCRNIFGLTFHYLHGDHAT